MLKCKIASEAACGKDCCCYDCTDVKTCENKCPTYEELGKKVLKECEELEQVETDVVKLDQKVPQAIKAMTDMLTQQKALEQQISDMREVIKAAMEQYDVKSFENDVVKITYIAATERKSIDSAKLKKEHPEIAEVYQKVSSVKSTVKIEIKG